MRKYEIKVLNNFQWPGRVEVFTPRSLSLVENLWWRFMPGATITVSARPSGYVYFGPYNALSHAPNDHYRPWLEKTVGKQGWDWDWGYHADDENLLVIKIRKKHAKYATMAKLLWS